MSALSSFLKTWLVDNGHAEKSWTDEQLWQSATQKALDSGSLSAAKFSELQGKVKAADVFGSVRIKKPSERYSHNKSVAKHARTGRPVRDERGREVETVSQLEHAKAGALLKRLAQKGGIACELNEHENELLAECFDSDSWCGKIGGEYKTGIAGTRVKALLDDATSGGAELVPEWFDDAVISFPLLHSELLPNVDLVNVPRGSSVESGSVGNPTSTWSIPDGTAITPFDTTALVAGIDTPIFPVTCAIEMGRDFLSDTVADVGRIVLRNIGERMLAELDRVIAVGNGTSEPQGLFVASGISDIGNPAGGAGATPEVDDYEALLFGLGKQYRRAELRPAFIANDLTYRRARGIPVGSADARRIFGMSHEDYEILNHKFVVQNDIANNLAGFGCLAKYRLYRRQAQEVRFTSEGRELALKNLMLLVVRGRFGGRLMDSNAFVYSDSWQA